MTKNSMKSLKPASEMDAFSYLPPEIILNILSRIPIKTVFTCKCVCKSWLELLESPEFARSHLPNSVPGLLIHHLNETLDTDIFRIFGFELDSLDIEGRELQKRVLELKSDNMFGVYSPTPWDTYIEGSTNGLLFVRNSFPKRDDHYILNPITHEYLKLPKPEGIPGRGTIVTRGFGVSRSSNQYKVVMIFHDLVPNPGAGLIRSIPEIACQVYTLGTRSWRSITAPRETLLDCSTGKLLNGNLHWLTFDSTGTLWISRFDIETEVFSKFRAPTLDSEGPPTEVGVLRDRLCVSEFSSMYGIIIYMMTDNGYGKEYWNKEYVISEIPNVVSSDGLIDAICLLKAFGDGDLLLALDNVCLLCYSSRTKSLEPVDMLNEEINGYPEADEGLRMKVMFTAMLYTPSFVSLKDFETKNRRSCLSFGVRRVRFEAK